jgi:hypothetical protein
MDDKRDRIDYHALFGDGDSSYNQGNLVECIRDQHLDSLTEYGQV